MLHSTVLFAVKKEYRFRKYTTEEGLAQNLVDCIFMDSKGFMWFGTWNGLSRFDGYEFKTFNARDSSTQALGSNFIRDISEDAFGNLWFATPDGLTVYLYEQDRMILHSHEEGSISSEKVNCLLMGQDNTLWIGGEKGIEKVRITGDEGRLEVIDRIPLDDDQASGADLSVFTMMTDLSGRLWAGTGSGLVVLDQSGQNQIRFSSMQGNIFSLSNNTVQALLMDREGYLWVGTSNGLNRFDHVNGRFYPYFHDAGNDYSLPHNTIMDLVLDSDGRLVVGTLGGVSIYQAEEDLFHNYSADMQNETRLSNDFVNCLFSDADGNVWVGTERGGVNHFNVHQNEFNYLLSIPGEKQSLSSNTINSIWEDEQALWVGTAGGGLNRIDRQTGVFRHYEHDAADPGSISSDFITCIHRDRMGQLLVGTWGGGLNRLRSGGEMSGRFQRHQEEVMQEDSLVNNFIAAMAEDRWGRIWVGTYGGLSTYYPSESRFAQIPIPEAYQLEKIGCLNFDLFNNLWIGTEEGLYFVPAQAEGPYMLDFQGMQKYTHHAEDPASLSGDYILSIMEDSFGNLWFGTYGNGLNLLHADSLASGQHHFVRFSESEGLCNNTIYGIQEDRAGNLWLSTDNGLSCFDIREGHFINYTTVDGLMSNQFYWSSSFRSPTGELFFGSMKGLLYFNPEKIESPLFRPRLSFCDLKIYNRSVGVNEKYFDQTVLTHPISVAEEITLSHKVKEFSLEFSALHYRHPGKVHYAYRLLGFNDSWQAVDADRRFARYTNLKGGNYVFHVRSGLKDGRYDSPPLELNIRILPPFWVQAWFKILVVLILIGSVSLYNRYRVISLKRRQRELEIQVADRTAMIRGQKDQLEKQNLEILQQRDKLVEMNRKVQQANQHQMRFFTHMSHEFKTPLTLITAPLEELITELSSRNPHYSTLVLVRRNARRLMHLVNQLMEVRRIKTGKMELRAYKSDLVAFLESITQSFNCLAEQKGIVFKFNSYPIELETYFDGDMIENMMYNLLSNAFKYTPSGGQIMVDLLVVRQWEALHGEVCIVGPDHGPGSRESGFAEIRVRDTGYGIAERELKNIFKRFYNIPASKERNIQGTGIGLYLTKELIRSHRGQLYIDSRKGEGTTFVILIPLGRDFLEPDEISYQGSGLEKTMPKLHVDLLAGQMDAGLEGAGARPAQAGPFPGSASTILIVDDDLDMIQFISASLAKSFKVITASDGLTGLELARKRLPDLILSDIVMPNMDGLELSNKLKSDILTSHIPVILLTSRDQIQDCLDGLHVGAMDFITKPFDLKILEAKIRNHLSNRENLKRLYTSTRPDDLRNVKKVKIHDQFLEHAIRTIEENMADPDFGVSELAERMCVSRSLLHKKLIASVQQSASAFINAIRLKKAAFLLLENGQKISETAFEVGFNDPKYFSKMFKKHFGITPSAYVEEHLFLS